MKIVNENLILFKNIKNIKDDLPARLAYSLNEYLVVSCDSFPFPSVSFPRSVPLNECMFCLQILLISDQLEYLLIYNSYLDPSKMQ